MAQSVSRLLGRRRGRFEELYRVAVGIVEKNLLAARTNHYFIPKPSAGPLQLGNPSRQVRELDDEPIPTAGLRALTVRASDGRPNSAGPRARE